MLMYLKHFKQRLDLPRKGVIGNALMVRSREIERAALEEPMTIRARRFAIRHHGSQRYGPYPYQYHLSSVAALVSEYLSELTACGPIQHAELASAAWLHDVLEDTDATVGEISSLFGMDVLNLVVAVTDEPGFETRAERHAATYPGLRAMGGQAVGLKLCDRIANVRASIELGNEQMLQMYRDEHAQFIAYLYRPNELTSLWRDLTELLAKHERPNR